MSLREISGVGPGMELRDGRYVLVRLLGTGGMATVWEAHDERLDRTVAVKLLSDALAHDEEYLARFRREARVAAGLNHPGLVNVFDFEAEAERPYLVVEYVDGGTLAERLRAHEPLDTDALAADLLDALGYIHRAGIIHRDVKPANVLLRRDGRACLTDFGVAAPQDATKITQTGQIPGTKSYMAPELLDGVAASELTDLYSCGVVLREAAGQAGGSATLIALADELAAADPAKRPPAAEVALERLRSAPAPGPATEPWSAIDTAPASTPPAPASTPRRPARRGAWALGAVAAVAIVAVIAVGGGDEAEPPPERSSAAAEPGAEQAPQHPAENADDAGTPTASGNDPARGATLNQQGFDLINAGDPEGAVPVLERAVRSFPEGTDDVNYAFALYNLGHALRLAGEPERAIPVLEERLQIPNQTDVVSSELELARAEAGE